MRIALSFLLLSVGSALAQPQNVSVTPSAEKGLIRTFTFRFYHPNGDASISWAEIDIGPALASGNSCFFIIQPSSNQIVLMGDNPGTQGWNAPITPGSSATTSNSQCTISASGASITPSGNYLYVNVPISFAPTYGPNATIWAISQDTSGQYSGGGNWTTLGSWTIGNPLQSRQVNPSSGNSPIGQQQIFTFTVSDDNGRQEIGAVQGLIGPVLSGANSCLFQVSPSGLVWLLSDQAVWMGPVAGGSAQTLQNSQCTISGQGLSVVPSGIVANGYDVGVPVTFNGYNGTVPIWLLTYDNFGGYAGWTQVGTRTVGSVGPDPLVTFRTCVGPGGAGLCRPLPTGTYNISQPIIVARSNVTVAGGSADRSQTVLVRAPSYTGPLMQVDASLPLTGITIQNLTFCGSNTLPNPGPSPSCPARVQTTCGTWTDQASTPGAPPPPALCVDLEVDNADTGLNPANPFGNTGPYSVTIANCDFEDAAGHALALYPTAPKKVNDIYMHDSAINSSAITGILVGVNPPAGVDYRSGRVCDARPNFNNDTSVYVPRNIRLEVNTFKYNNTGSVAMAPARWVGMRTNTFTGNYIRPQVLGNDAGGNVFIDQCADTVQIYNNMMTGPSTYPQTSGLELWGRNIDVQGNNITNYPNEGIGTNSVYNATIRNNQILNNDQNLSRDGTRTGGILVWTSGPGGPCDPIPRDTQIVTISSGNTSTGQAYGVDLGDRGQDSRHTINSLTITNDNNLTGNSVAAISVSPIVTVNGYAGPAPTLDAPSTILGALPVNPVSPITSKCSTPGSDRETFTFSASHVNGPGSLLWLMAQFNVTGNDDGSGGPDSGAQGCQLYYAPSSNVLYLDGPNGGFNWIGSSAVGPGGSDLSNGYCTIHAGSPASQVQTEPKILNLTLDIEFPYSSSTPKHKHIFEITGDSNGNQSNGFAWKYWGWWATP